MAAIKKLMDEVMSGPSAPEEREGPMAAEYQILAAARKLSLFAAGVATQKYMQAIADQQEIMGAMADCISEVFAIESSILRAEKVVAMKGEAGAAQAIAMTRYYVHKAMQTVEQSARKVIAGSADGDMLRTQMAIVRRLSKYEPADTIAIGRQIAKAVIAAGRYTV